MIRLVHPETNKLSEPVNRLDILNSIDTRTHLLVQLTPDVNHDDPDFHLICKVVSKKEHFEEERRRKAQAKEAKKASRVSGEMAKKTLEINWAIDRHDLSHRLQRAKEFLEEGRILEILLAAKRRGRKATTDECNAVLRRIRDLVATVEGAKEKEVEPGKLGGAMKLQFLGRPLRQETAQGEAETAEGGPERQEN